MSDAVRRSPSPVGCDVQRLPAAFLLMSLISFFVFADFSSTTSPPADLESSVSLGRKRKVSVGSKSNLNSDFI